MNPADKTAGFSALRAVAPLIAAAQGRRAVNDLGEAVALILRDEAGIEIRRTGMYGAPYMHHHKARVATIATALRAVFGLPKTENRSENSEISESEKPFSPQTPLSEEEKKKRNISSSSSSSYGEASKGEWDEYAREIGIFGSEISEKAWRNYCENGPKTVKYWRRYLSAYKANAEKSAAKSSEKFAHLAGAFGTKTEAAK